MGLLLVSSALPALPWCSCVWQPLGWQTGALLLLQTLGWMEPIDTGFFVSFGSVCVGVAEVFCDVQEMKRVVGRPEGAESQICVLQSSALPPAALPIAFLRSMGEQTPMKEFLVLPTCTGYPQL